MGNSQNLDKKKEKTILWLDKNVYNEENKKTYKLNLQKLINYNFLCFTSVEKILDFIKEHLNYFQFRNFFIIVSGKLAETFYNEYVKITEKYIIIATIIVYCFNQKYHETKPYFKDTFLNAGGITCDFNYVLDFILKNEKKNDIIMGGGGKYIPAKQSYGNVFMEVDPSKEYELSLAILLGRIINSSLLKEGDIRNFQRNITKKYRNDYPKEQLNLIKPEIEVPLHILSKYFMKFYSLEGPFYGHLNLDLTNDKFDDYLPFIFLLYDALSKGYINSYRKQLYRGGKLSQQEFNEIISKTKKNSKEKLFYFSKNFLSFSKDLDKARSFLNNKSGTVTVLFILEGPKNKDFYLTNLDIESISAFSNEKEVLILPLTCFEIIKIDNEETYKGVKYRKIYLKYLDKYEKSITEKIDYLKENNNEEERAKFFENSMDTMFGKILQKTYDKNLKISAKFCKIVGSPPNNNFFANQLANSFLSKMLKSLGKIGDQTAMHVDDEIPNMLIKDETNKNNKVLEFFKSFGKNFREEFKNFNNYEFDQGYSIGYCLGNFLYDFETFKKAPTKEKALNIASLALACGPPVLKLIPKIKVDIFDKLVISNFDVSDIFNGFNILYAVGFELLSIFNFYFRYKRNKTLTLKYCLKRAITLGVSISFSIIGNLAIKASVFGLKIFLGFTLGPFATALVGLLGGLAFGFAGKALGNLISDKIFGKDQFILTSAHLYYKYIPDKYRQLGNNPHLKWNKTYLCSSVESYIIECIVNEEEVNMRVMNIPKDVYELKECLGYEIIDYTKINDSINDDDYSTEEDEQVLNQTKFKSKKLYNENGKFLGDLVIPYKGIKDNASRVDFVIYGINKKEMKNKEWVNYKEKEKLIQVGFILSTY